MHVSITNKLNRGDRLLRFGIWEDNKCMLCETRSESHEHLFFNRPFFSEVWLVLQKKCNVRWPIKRPWKQCVNFMSSLLKEKDMLSIIKRLGFIGAVYYIRLERNRRFFQNKRKNENLIIKESVESVRARIPTLRNAKRIIQMFGFQINGMFICHFQYGLIFSFVYFMCAEGV